MLTSVLRMPNCTELHAASVGTARAALEEKYLEDLELALSEFRHATAEKRDEARSECLARLRRFTHLVLAKPASQD
jgi:hypothetical protein